MNQYFPWAGEFAPAGTGCLAVPRCRARPRRRRSKWPTRWARWGRRPLDPAWNTKLKPVLNDVNIRRRAPWRSTARPTSRSSTAASADWPTASTARRSPYYKNPGYPAYNPTQGQGPGQRVQVEEQRVDGRASSSTSSRAVRRRPEAVRVLPAAVGRVGITVTPRPLGQSTLINNVIYGEYDCATWNQFGGVDPSLNYVWFDSLPATRRRPQGTWVCQAFPRDPHRGCGELRPPGRPGRRESVLTALAAPPGSAAQQSRPGRRSTSVRQGHPLPVPRHVGHCLGRTHERAELGVGTAATARPAA